MTDIIWKGMNVPAMGDIRFNLPIKSEQFMRIPESRRDEFANLVGAVKTYRMKTLIEF